MDIAVNAGIARIGGHVALHPWFAAKNGFRGLRDCRSRCRRASNDVTDDIVWGVALVFAVIEKI